MLNLTTLALFLGRGICFSKIMSNGSGSQISAPEKSFFYYELFKNAVVGMGVADMEGNLVDFNDAILRPGKYTREDMQQIKNVGNLYALPEERTRALSLAQRQGYLNRFPCKFKRKDGSTYQALMTLRMVNFEDKRYWLATVEDLSGAIP